jgi:hypothetical protein
MNGFMSQRSRRAAKPWIAVIVVIVTLGRALIPAGFMPSSGAGFPLMLCSGHGMAMPGGNPDSHDGHSAPRHDSPICPFAAASVLGAAPGFAIAPFAVIPAISQAPIQSATRTAELAGPPRAQSPRAPPTFNS